jgi:hypothetical protein
LRTAVASVLTTTVTPIVVANVLSQSGSERGKLGFYAELAAERDTGTSFPAPTDMPRVSSRRANVIAERLARGTVDNVQFTSSLRAINPAMRKQWSRLRSNNIVRAQHWRHDDGPRPRLCVIHGFMGSSYVLNGLFFSLPWYYRAGYDVLLYTFVSRTASRKILALQWIRLLRAWAERFRRVDGPSRARLPVGRRLSAPHRCRTGGIDRAFAGRVHLGLACHGRRPARGRDPQLPGCHAREVVRRMVPRASELVKLGLWLTGIDRDELDAGLAYHCPLNYLPMVPKERRMIITGLGDRMAPPEHAVMLWEHWDRCRLHWFPGSHVMHISQLDYLPG